MVKAYGYKSFRHLRKELGIDKLFDKKRTGRPKQSYPKKVMDELVSILKQDKSVSEFLKYVNLNEDLLSVIRNNHELGKNGFTKNLFNKMIRSFGYKNLGHLKNEIAVYNHKVVSIEYLDEKIDTGTLTIDGNEELHNYHTFAISHCNIYTCNSEIDDALYFRNRLFLALNFPKEYMSQEDPQVTKMSPSSLNWRLARLVERLQMSLSDGMMQIAIRHLELRGFPESLYEDLAIKLTPPSHYREISNNEIDEIKYNRAMALVGSQLMSKFDIFTRILNVSEEEAKELVARSTLQQVQELKLQVMAQNPQLLGIAMPNQQPGMEMGTEAGGPSPMLTGQEGQPPAPPPPEGQPGLPPPGPPNEGLEIPGQSPEPKNAMDTFGQQPKAQVRKLPEPTDDEIKEYDLEVQDYSQGLDFEETDEIELGDD
jgi:hypothetical protein